MWLFTGIDGREGRGAAARLGDLSADLRGTSLDEIEPRGLRFDPPFGEGVYESREPSRVGCLTGGSVAFVPGSAEGMKLDVRGDADFAAL